MSCLLILKNGVQVRVDGVSASWAKHIRRTKGVIHIKHESGQKMKVEGGDIKRIVVVPDLSPSNPSV